jgi:hypothetical protein
VEKGKEGVAVILQHHPASAAMVGESCVKPMISRRRQGSERDHGFYTGSGEVKALTLLPPENNKEGTGFCASISPGGAIGEKTPEEPNFRFS